MAPEQLRDEHKTTVKKPVEGRPGEVHGGGDAPPMAVLQQTVGNRAVQRLIAQRNGDGSFELDDETVDRTNRKRNSRQPLG